MTDRRERAIEIFDEIVDVLDADRKTDQVIGNAGALARLLGIVNNLDREKLSINTLDHFNKNLTFKNIADGLFDICTRLMTE